MRHAFVPRLLLVLLLTFAATLALAQSQATTGVIEGTVTDATGGVLPGVTVTLRNTATNFEQVQVTDSAGRFRGVLLPLGPYEVKASLEGFAPQTVRGIDLGVGQTRTVEIKLSQAAVSEELVVTAEAPLIETARTEGATRLSEEAMSDLPNNGRNFLEMTKLTPGVTIVQGPDGDELSINGQKGISNNVSVDGADFNNPFFGEQRGGQRPAFTFNLDAVKELVVVADGANAEFGRSQSGFVNVITKSGTNELRGTAHLVFKSDALSDDPKTPNGGTAPYEFDQTQVGFTLGGPLVQDKVFYFTAFDLQAASTTKQTSPGRIEQRVVDALARLGSPNENGPIDRTNDARVFLGKIDWNINQGNLATIRYNYTWSEQENGTFDVDSWGRSANAIEQDHSHAGTGSLITTFRSNLLNEFRFQYAREDRPRPYNGPNITRYRLRLRQGLPLRHALLHPGRVLRHARAVQRQHLLAARRALDQGGRRVQPRELGADLRRLRQRPLHLQLHRRIPELPEQPQLRRVLERHLVADRGLPGGHRDRRSRSPLPPAGRRRRAVGRRSGHAEHPPDRAGRVHSGLVAGHAQPERAIRPPLGSAAAARSDHRSG
jgi:hypothetical protein